MPTQQQLEDALSTKHLHADLKGRSVRGGFVTLTSQGSQFLIQTLFTVVLARLLTPADFGLVAMVTAITGLGQAFADVGLSEATIQREEITHDQVSALFWINAAVGLGLMLIVVALGPVFTWFYGEPQLTYITYLLSLLFLICGLRVQPEALLKRQMKFTSLAVRDITANALGVFVSIAMAMRGMGYWALVAFPLAVNSIQTLLSWLMVNWRPGCPHRDAKVGSLVLFGSNVAASYFIFTVIRSVDKVLVGWIWGAGPLGLYSKAYNLLMRPISQLNAPVAGVAVPAFSRIQSYPERYARYYLRAVNLIMWIGAPLFGFLFVVAGPVIVLLLGDQWREATPVFQVLVVSAPGQLLLESTVWLLVSRGQSERLRKLLLTILPVIIGSFAIGLPFGIKWVALSYCVAFLGILPWILKFSFQGTSLTLHRLFRSLLQPVSVGLSAVLVGEFALHLIAPRGAFSQFAVVGASFAAIFSLSALLRPVRNEVISLTSLLNELRFPGQVA